MQDVIADGPTDSPHHYGGGRLCIWHPKGPPERRWVHQDGLLQLIIHAPRVHLLKEAWWREERVRISEALREIQRDLATYEAVMTIERCAEVADNSHGVRLPIAHRMRVRRSDLALPSP